VYDGPEGKESVSDKGGEDTTDIYIVPLYGDREGWWIVNAKTLMNQHVGKDWIQEVKDGGGVPIAGPFAHEDNAKAAWRLMYG
jgi:hypothetical protein